MRGTCRLSDHAYSGTGATVATGTAACAGTDVPVTVDGSMRASERCEVMTCWPESASWVATTSTCHGFVSSRAGNRKIASAPRTSCLPSGVNALHRGMSYNIHPTAAHPTRHAHSVTSKATQVRRNAASRENPMFGGRIAVGPPFVIARPSHQRGRSNL